MFYQTTMSNNEPNLGFNSSINQSLMNSQVMSLQAKKELEEIENMDEIQELLKIFYKFFVGAKNKPKPKNDENLPKYYKNKYYEPSKVNQKPKNLFDKASEIGIKKQKVNRSSKAWDFGGIDDDVKNEENGDGTDRVRDKKMNTNINDSIASSLHEEFKTEEDFFDTGRSHDPAIKQSTG